jgi:hypothetical protein
MKKIFVIVFVLVGLNVWSQTSKEITVGKQWGNDVVVQMKSDFPRPGFRNDINTNVRRHFMKSFKGAKNVLWQVDEHETVVSFRLNNENVVSYYGRKGEHLCTLKYYTEKELDNAVAEFVKHEAGTDFSIYLVTELIQGDYTVYDVSLQSDSYWCKVKLMKTTDGNLVKVADNDVFLKG